MKNKDNLFRIFTGDSITVGLIKSELEQKGIASFVRDDFQSSLGAGFVSGIPNNIDIYVEEINLEEAQEIINILSVD